MNQNLPNGVPPQFNTMQHVPPQYKMAAPFNGLDSSHSSRDSSPLLRHHQIPPSQLPPSRVEIPASQLPPNRAHSSNVSQITHGYAHLSVSGNSANEVTPFSSPKIDMFSTSTPTQGPIKNDVSADQNKLKPSVSNFKSSVLSPISTDTKESVTSTQSTFTHSATSQFTNVKQHQNISEHGNDSNKLNSSVETVTNKNTPPSQTTTLDQDKQDSNKSIPLFTNQEMNKLANTSQKRFDINMFTNRQNPGSEQTQRSVEVESQNLHQQQKQVNLHHSGSQQQNLQASASQLYTTQFSSQQMPASQHPIGQYQKVNHFPVDNGNMPVQNLMPQNLSSINTQYHQHTPFTSSNQFVHNISPVNTYQRLGNEINFEQNRAFAPTNAPSDGQRMQQNPFPPDFNAATDKPNHKFPANFNPMIRPKMQSSLSQSRLNTNMPPNQYVQPVGQLPPNIRPISQEFGSMPNLTERQMPPKSSNLPGAPHSNQGNFAGPTAIPQANLQNIPSSNQGRVHSSRYPQPSVGNYATQQPFQATQGYQQQTYYQNQPGYQTQPPNQFQSYDQNLSVTQAGFNKLWGKESHDLLQTPNVLPTTKVEGPKVSLGQDFLDAVNCNPDIFRCTMTKIPETNSLLQKSRLPLGVLIHPFRDLNHLPVIQCNTIVRCRACRTYINPFVFFVDSKRWKCNLCYRVNELPEEFQYDPVSKTYGDPSRRPEIKSSTIEYIAPAEYMLRPPQPAVYLFLLDVSRLAVETGYLHTVCNILSAELTNLPGDARTHIGFLAYDSALHFYSLSEGQSQPHEMTILDIDDVFLPCPDNLLVNLQDRMELVSDLLSQLPTRYNNTFDTGSALGAALQVAYKMMAGTGGRVTVFQAVLPTLGPGSLISREDPSQRASTETPHLNPANDFYKRLALECSGQQIAVDLFIINSQYIDLATISGISRFSGGCIHHFPLFKASRTLQNDSLERCFRRYITRKIGFEAVMRIRCTRGLSIHTFHGNFFVRSTDLLSLPNINPDAGFGMQVAIEENLSDVQTVCFQAALLYTSSKGERRIRVHTMCLPIASTLTDIINSADQQCIIGLLSKMAVDRSMQSSLSDAREAFLNVAIDILSSYKLSLHMGNKSSSLLAPQCLKLLPLYISALLKSMAFRIGMSTRLDDRIKAMCDMKTKPLPYLIQQIYPDLYPVHNLEEQNVVLNEEEEQVHVPPRLQLTARNVDLTGAYLLDTGEHMVVLVCADVSSTFLNQVLGVADFISISDEMYELPILENPHNQRLHTFLNYLNDEKPFPATIQIMRENSPNRSVFIERLIEDRMENSLSYHEFLQHIKSQVK